MTCHTPARPLTPRQTEIAALVGAGYTYPEIAAICSISMRTVEHHVEAIALLLPRMPGVAPRRRVRFFMRAKHAGDRHARVLRSTHIEGDERVRHFTSDTPPDSPCTCR